MIVIGRRDDDGIDVPLALEKASPIVVLDGIRVGFERLGGLLGVYVTERDDFRAGILQRIQVVCAAASRANHSHTQHVAGRHASVRDGRSRERPRDGSGPSDEGSAAERVAGRTHMS